VVPAVRAAQVRRGGRLAVHLRREHPPVAGRPDDPGEVAEAGGTPGEPRPGPDHLDRRVRAQRPLEHGEVGVLEPPDVLLEQGAGGRVGGLRDVVRGRGHLLEPRTRPLQGALDGGHGHVEHPATSAAGTSSTSRSSRTARCRGGSSCSPATSASRTPSRTAATAAGSSDSGVTRASGTGPEPPHTRCLGDRTAGVVRRPAEPGGQRAAATVVRGRVRVRAGSIARP